VSQKYQLPLLADERDFQNLICDLFNQLERTNSFSEFGRKGQEQKGIDIYSPVKKIVIQCKKKDVSRPGLQKELINELSRG